MSSVSPVFHIVVKLNNFQTNLFSTHCLLVCQLGAPWSGGLIHHVKNEISLMAPRVEGLSSSSLINRLSSNIWSLVGS